MSKDSYLSTSIAGSLIYKPIILQLTYGKRLAVLVCGKLVLDLLVLKECNEDDGSG